MNRRRDSWRTRSADSLVRVLACARLVRTWLSALRLQLRDLRGPWLACLTVPLPVMVFWRSHDGRCVALWCFCAACFSLVACAFRPSGPPRPPWEQRLLAVGVALSTAWAVFSLLWLALVDAHDLVALFIGFQILVPSFCVVPCLTLATRKPFAAVVFSAFLLGSMKMLAGVVVNLVYGWGDGHHEFPWTSPNLMLSAFWVNATVLCACCYWLGAKKFRIAYESLA